MKAPPRWRALPGEPQLVQRPAPPETREGEPLPWETLNLLAAQSLETPAQQWQAPPRWRA